MKENAHTTAVHELADAVQLLLDAAPAGLSPALLETLLAAVGRTRTMLPPHLFYAAVEQAPVAISITDPEANILYVNPSFERVTGYGRGEAVGHNESMLSDKCTPVQVYEQLWQCLQTQQVWSGTLVNRRKDGRRYLAELLIAPVVDEAGVTRHYLGLHRDITDLHRLEQQVLNQKHLIEGMVDAAPVVIALLDEQGRVILDNRAYRELAAVLDTDPALALLATLQPDLETPGEPGPLFADVELSFEPADGSPIRWFTWSASRVVAQDDSAGGFFARPARRYLLLVAQEITRLKQQQEEVRRNALRALVAEEAMVQGMREAIAAAEFQMQGPFNMLKAALGMLERRAGGEANDHLMGVLNQALAAGQETLEMLRSAMPSERREPLTRINLNQLLRDALSLVTERMLALGVEVEWRPAHRLPPLTGYENRLRAIFKQLLDNALDAMGTDRVRRRELRLFTDTVGDVLRVVIEDTGPGIPDELRLKVFEPFFTTRAEHTGTGLSMVQEVVNQHGGSVWLEPAPEGGCRVQLQLPVSSTRHFNKN